MVDPLLDSLVFLLRYRRAPVESTTRFQGMKHDSAILPRLQGQLETVLDAHGRFRDVIYDTQGIRDDGVDLAVRIPLKESDAMPRLIGLQVKSFDDMSKEGHMEKLKAQHSDAIRKVHGLDCYLILLCTDMTKHRKKVQSVMQEFRSDPITEVIEPQFAYTFLQHPRTRIDAIVNRFLENSDLVFKDAFREIADLDGPSARALEIYFTVEYVLTGRVEYDQHSLLADQKLERIYRELRERQAELLAAYMNEENNEADSEDEPDDEEGLEEENDDEPVEMMDFQDQLAADLDQMESRGVSRDSDSGVFRLQVDQRRASIAVIANALARFRYSRSELMDYAFDLFGIRD